MALSENLSITESIKAPIGFSVLFFLARDPSRASKREKIKKSQDPIFICSKTINIEAIIVPKKAIKLRYVAEKLCLSNKPTKGPDIFSNGFLRRCIIWISLRKKFAFL